jgi:hypothetical protein
MTHQLEQRLAKALSDESVTSSMLAELIAETGEAITLADKDAEEIRVRALDPALSPNLSKARAAIEDAQFAANRLRTLQPRLVKRLAHTQYREAHAKWLASYETARAKRDLAAEELRQVYPEVVGKLVELLTRIRAIDAEARRVNEAKPVGRDIPWDGNHSILPTEYHARGVDGFRDPSHSLDKGMRLPDFAKPGEAHWPPHKLPRSIF